jgi:hypothetical protein
MDGNLADNLAASQARTPKLPVMPCIDPLGRWHMSVRAAARAWGIHPSSLYQIVLAGRHGWRRAPLPSDQG